MKFIDDKSNKLSWWNRNYFYVGTFIFIVINVLNYAVLSYGDNILQSPNWGHFDLTNLVYCFVGNFQHGTIVHLWGNVLSLIMAGLYLERKMGSINFTLLTLSGCVLASIAKAAISLSAPAGFSCVTFFLFACLIVDYCFSFKKSRRNKTNIILGAILIFLIYVIGMCLDFNNGIVFYAWPYQLLTNSGHYGGFIVGIILALAINLARLKTEQQSTPNLDIQLKGGEKAKKIVYSVIGSLMAVLAICCGAITGYAASRKTLTVNISDPTYNYEKTYELDQDNNTSLFFYLLDYFSSLNVEEKDRYILEIYSDENYERQQDYDIWQYDSINPSTFSFMNFLSGGDHLPLAMPSTMNFYIKVFKGYGITFDNYDAYCSDQIESNALIANNKMPYNTPHYLREFSAFDFVEENGTYKFKLEHLKPEYSTSNILVSYTDSQSQKHTFYADNEGYFTISNINADIALHIEQI